VVLIEPARALLRWGRPMPASATPPRSAQWLAVIAPATVHVHDFRQAPRLNCRSKLRAITNASPIRWHCSLRRLLREPAINLLQGEFAPNHRHMPAQNCGEEPDCLPPPGVILALAYAACDYLRLKRESDRLELAQHDALRATLPELGDVAGDPRQLMQSALTRMRGDSATGGLLPLLGRSGRAFGHDAGLAQEHGVPQRDARTGLRAPDVPTLDLVREQLANIRD
jgi:general secretion pathway protein L